MGKESHGLSSPNSSASRYSGREGKEEAVISRNAAEVKMWRELPWNLMDLRVLFCLVSGFTKFLSFQQNIFTDSPSISYLLLH